MKKELVIPEGVNAEADGKKVTVSGEKGKVERTFKYFFDIKIEKTDNKIVVSSDSDRKKVRATIGTINAHIKNMITGVTKGFTYKMRVVYTHFPTTVKVEGNKIFINNFLGEKVPRVARILGDTKVQVDGQDVSVSGINIEDVGDTCNNIEQACRIKAKDRRVFQDGIYLLQKKK